MIDPGAAPLGPAIHAAFAMLSVGLVCALVRVVRGPSLPDRVAGLDLVGLLTTGLIVLYGLGTEQRHLLRPAVVLALIAFLGTVAFAYYLERRV